MNYYQELKARADILQVANNLGFQFNRVGSNIQGDCPRHGSEKGRCLTIYDHTQSFYCFHCGEGGDVINLVELFLKCDQKGARDYLADQVGMSRLADRNLTPEEKAKLEADYQEEKLVYGMLTAAANWFHGQLNHHPDIKDHLINHYKFSQRIIDELKIGIAPPTQGQESALAQYLIKNFPQFKGKLYLSGLFNYSDPIKGPFYDYFNGRIMFPYWRLGHVVYFKGRACQLTPVDNYECYSLGDETRPPDFVKYKALRSHDPKNDKKKHISKFIQGGIFLGEDSIRGASDVIITEGVPDWVSAIDHGFKAISPGTTNFKGEDREKLGALLKDKTVWLVFDNEDNEAGLKGALSTGKYLMEQGNLVYLITLPKPEGTSKIDLNEYLRNHTAEDLDKLKGEAKSVIHLLIEGLPEHQLKAMTEIEADIIPILAKMKPSYRPIIVEDLSEQTKISKAIIALALKNEIKRLGECQSREEEPPNPEVIKQAEAISTDPNLFKNRLDLINQAGVVGERNVIAMYLATLDSRLLPGDAANINTLATKNAGHFGSGKSFALLMSLSIYPEECYHLITNGSPKSFYYLTGGLSHKALIVAEGFQFQKNNAADSEMVYAVRSLISEGTIKYQVAGKDNEGNITTMEKKLDGPTSFITTTIMEKLEPQLEDRLFTVHPNESVEQTRNILTATADRAAGLMSPLEKNIVAAWKQYHKMLKPVEVIIPYAPDIAEFIIEEAAPPISVRRAFKRVLSVIKAVACVYQYQRSEAGKNKITAEIADYWMALQIVRESFKESMGLLSEENKERLTFISNNPHATYKTLMDAWKISKAAVSNWVKERVKDGAIVWCDNDGKEILDDKELKRAKSASRAFIKMAESYAIETYLGLPSPYDLTGDRDWNEGGKLYQQYDLKLNETHEPEAMIEPETESITAPDEDYSQDEEVSWEPDYDELDDEFGDVPQDFVQKSLAELGIGEI